MPELPEVETTARLVRPLLVGRRILSSHVDWERSLGGARKRRFAAQVVGAQIARVHRRAKYIRLDLEREGAAAGTILVHLRMSGRLVVEDADTERSAYARVSLGLDETRRLDFIDVRKFGRFQYHRDVEPVLAPLGPEPLERPFTAEWLHEALHTRKRIVKPLLLDQHFLAGLGNIYVDESLFRARIHPERQSHTLRRPATRALHAAIVDVLAHAVAKEGSSFDTFYRTPEGQPGSYQDEFQVYGRHGKPCRHCGATVRRLVVGQRGTHICPRCQRRPA